MGNLARTNMQTTRRMNFKNLGVNVSGLRHLSQLALGSARSSSSSLQGTPTTPIARTPMTPATPTSPFVNALWTHLDDQQKESTIDLNEHLVKANWILLRSRALCLFTARALSSTAKHQRKLKLMAEVVARKEQEIERMMINESSEETASDDCPSPVHRGRRAAPRIPRMVLNESSDEPSDESPSVSLSPLPSPSPRHRRGRRNGPRRPSDPQLSLHKRRKRTAGSA